MDLTGTTFWILSGAALFTGWRVFRTDSMVRAAFLLLASFISVAGIMLLLAASYLGVATIFMMTVEMLVMALFMIMFMMNPAGLNPMSMIHQPRIAAAAGAGLFAVLVAVIAATDFASQPLERGRNVIAQLGHELLGDSMLVFETAGIVLLATMICSVVLSSRSGRFGRADEGSEPPPLFPEEEHHP